MKSVRLEVRCCCVPQNLLGWVDVPEARLRVGEFLPFVLRVPIPKNFGQHPELVESNAAAVRLEMAFYNVRDVDSDDFGTTSIALKSGELPIETLRRIPGFIENKA